MYAIGAGFFAALASLLTKITLIPEDLIHQLLPHLSSSIYFQYATRLISLLSIFAANAVMWLLFSKALNASHSSHIPTALNASSNFLFSGLLGWLVFGEQVSLKWICGMLLVLLGNLLVARDNEPRVKIKSN